MATAKQTSEGSFPPQAEPTSSSSALNSCTGMAASNNACGGDGGCSTLQSLQTLRLDQCPSAKDIVDHSSCICCQRTGSCSEDPENCASLGLSGAPQPAEKNNPGPSTLDQGCFTKGTDDAAHEAPAPQGTAVPCTLDAAPQADTSTPGTPSGTPVVYHRRVQQRSLCELCGRARAAVKRPKTGQQVCKDCFFLAFENEVCETVVKNSLFKRGQRVALGASGGKDSTVLAHVLSLLNKRHDWGLNLFLLSVDEGITGYRDDSLETVKRNEQQYGIPLTIVSYKDLYGWTMDEIVAAVGRKNNCTFCGVFRRQALDRGATLLKADRLATGHNADDIAETVLLNVVRGDIARLGRCAAIVTGDEGALPRCKPFKYTYEKEIVMYAHFKKLDYFSTECIYSPEAYRGFVREYIKDLESIRPSAILDVVRSAEEMRVAQTARMPLQGVCSQCGYISSQKRCKACVLLDGLNRGLPKLGISRTRGAAS